MTGKGHRWPLQELEPQWLTAEPHRYNVGFSFDCPTHGTHRLTVRFDAPYDGFGPVTGEGLLVHLVCNGSFDEVTVTALDGLETLDFNGIEHGECGKLRIIDGHVERARYLSWR